MGARTVRDDDLAKKRTKKQSETPGTIESSAAGNRKKRSVDKGKGSTHTHPQIKNRPVNQITY